MFIWQILLYTFLFLSISYADDNSITKTKNQLTKIEIKIKLLEKNLKKSHDKQQLLNCELDKTKKRVEELKIKIAQIKQNIDNKQAEIEPIQMEITKLNQRVITLQESFSKYLVAKYKFDNDESFTFLLQQKNLQNIERILIYYQYIVNANKKVMDELQLTKQQLNVNNNKLNQELQELYNYQKQAKKTLKSLQHNKTYQKAIIAQLNKDINKGQKTLDEYRENQINLSKLITKLTSQSVLQTKVPMTKLKNQLIFPVNIKKAHIEKVHQGIVFYTDEGTKVQAVSPGKIVFADWLNGYGLLIIVDHGWGFMSLYGNNLSLLKHTGDTVNLGEEIAKVGHSGVFPKNGLYFEIRHHGKTMPPLEWLRQ